MRMVSDDTVDVFMPKLGHDIESCTITMVHDGVGRAKKMMVELDEKSLVYLTRASKYFWDNTNALDNIDGETDDGADAVDAGRPHADDDRGDCDADKEGAVQGSEFIVVSTEQAFASSASGAYENSALFAAFKRGSSER